MPDYLFNIFLFSYSSIIPLWVVAIIACFFIPRGSKKFVVLIAFIATLLLLLATAMNPAIRYKNTYDQQSDRFYQNQQRQQENVRQNRLQSPIIDNSRPIPQAPSSEELDQRADELTNWKDRNNND